MADDAKLPNLGGNGFIWILLVAASTYFVAHQIPLQGSRPATADRSIRERIGEQHVDARLWQDPFAAVAETLAKSPELKPENCKHTDGQYDHVKLYCRPPSEASSSKGALALIVSVSAAPYSEDQEARRRLRYAVLAGLAAEGFFPEDPQHIGFYWPSPAAPSQAYQSADIWSQPPSWRQPLSPTKSRHPLRPRRMSTNGRLAGGTLRFSDWPHRLTMSRHPLPDREITSLARFHLSGSGPTAR